MLIILCLEQNGFQQTFEHKKNHFLESSNQSTQ